MPSRLWKTFRLAVVPLACSLAALPAPAVPISGNAVPPQAAQFRPHKLFLKYASPYDILKRLGWDNPHPSPSSGPGTSGLVTGNIVPVGVDHVYAIEGDNSLLVFATADGFNVVKNIVMPLDVAPRQVTVKVEFLYASAADVDALGIDFNAVPTSVEVVSGDDAVRLYSLAGKIKVRLIAPPMATTADDDPAFFPMRQFIPFSTVNTTIVPNGSAVTASQNYQSLENLLTVWPHINSNGNIIVGVEPVLEGDRFSKNGPHVSIAPLVLQTLPSGSTVAIRLALTNDEADSLLSPNKPTVSKNTQPMTLLIFVTPTIVITEDSPKTPPALGGPTAP